MNLTETISIRGEVKISLIDSKTGIVKAKRNINNLVVQSGKDLIAAVFNGSSTATVTHVELGTNTPVTAAALTQTALVDPVTPRVAVTKTLNSNPATIEYEATFGPGVATGSIGEAGLLTAASAGTLVARTTFASIPKGADDLILVNWTLIFG